MAPISALHKRAADSVSVSSTVCKSNDERLMTFSTSDIAVCWRSTSLSSRESLATSALECAAEELRIPAALDAFLGVLLGLAALGAVPCFDGLFLPRCFLLRKPLLTGFRPMSCPQSGAILPALDRSRKGQPWLNLRSTLHILVGLPRARPGQQSPAGANAHDDRKGFSHRCTQDWRTNTSITC